MKNLLIKNGILISGANQFHQVKKDIYIENGKIAKIEDQLQISCTCIDAKGCFVTPGFIDIHTHCYSKTPLGVDPDILGLQRGATTILDAGSSGADTYEDFKTHVIDQCKTKVLTLLNASKEGIMVGHELDCPKKIDEKKTIAMVQRYPDNIVGIKVRASSSVVGTMGLTPIQRAKKLAEKLKLPLTVHVGNYPPALSEVLNLLEQGDVVTHAFHGKKGGLLKADGTVISEALDARKRGVLFDVGHGAASFSFDIFQKALQVGFDCDLISTDLHIRNYNGPVYDLISVLNKVIGCGENLENAIDKCTYQAAKTYGLKDIGRIKVGYEADLNIIQRKACYETVMDSLENELVLNEKLILYKTIISRDGKSYVQDHKL